MSEKTAEELFNEPSSKSAEDLFNEGEPGHAGHEPYAAGPHKPQPEKLTDLPLGSTWDAAKNFANTMTFGAAPVLEGGMGAVMEAATQPVTHPNISPQEANQRLLDAYRAVRDEGAKEHAASSGTGLGKLGSAAAFVAPHPLLPNGLELGPKTLPATARKALGSGAVGAGVGGVSGLANSPADVTKLDAPNLGRAALDTLGGAASGGLTSAALGAGTEAITSPVRKLAETQALRAAGLRGGIKNSLQKDLGIQNMDEARELGRQFLNEGLIPPVGGSESVANRAEKLQGRAGNSVGATLNQFEVGGHQFDYPEAAEAMRAPIMDPKQTTAVARAQAGKALDLANTIGMDQALDTPGSIIGANRAKSDAWKAANFSNDPDLAAVAYRKAVSGLKGNIEDQVSRALGPEAAANLANANQKYGIAADALKLAANASTRDAAKKGFGLPEILAITTGAGATGGSMSGHPVAGGLVGGGLALGGKAFDKWGHSTAARSADALANKLEASTGGHVGGVLGERLEDKYAEDEKNKLAPWEQFLHKEQP